MTLLKKSALLVLGFSVSVFAGDICGGVYDAGDYPRASDCYIGELKKNKTMVNYFYAGDSLVRIGRYKEAGSYLKEAEKLATGQNDLRIIYNRLSIVYGNLGDKNLELAYDMKYLDLSLKIGEAHEIGIAYGNLGTYYIEYDTNKALEFFTKSLEYKQENERAETYQNMAKTYADMKDTKKAEEYFQKAIDIEINTGNYLLLCYTKTNFGIYNKIENKFHEALELLSDAKDICHKVGDINHEAHALAELGYLNYKKGNTALANEYINRAMTLAKQSGDTVTLSDTIFDYKVIKGLIKE